MTLFLEDPIDDVGGRTATFAAAGAEPKGFFDGPIGYVPGVALVKAEVGLAQDLINPERRARMGALYSATDQAQTFIDNTFSREDARTEAYQRRIDAIHKATGVQLSNPMDASKMAAVADFGAIGDVTGGRAGLRDLAGEQLSAFKNQLADLRGKFPDQAALFDQSFDADVSAIVSGADAGQKRASAEGEELSAFGNLAATFAGSARGMLRDPMQIATLFVGGGAGTATTVAGRIGQTMLTEAIVNAGAEIPVQVSAQKWRAENGLENGVIPGLKQVGLAALFGGALGGLITGGKEISSLFKVSDKAGREAVERVAIGKPDAGDLETVADRLGVAVSPDDLKAAAISRDQVELDDAAFGTKPEGITADEAQQLQRSGVEMVEADAPVPAGPVQKPARDAAEDVVLSEALAPADRVTVQGKPVAFERFDPSTIGTDAQAYQYKGGGDAAGVTKRLGGVKRWDPTASGKVMVHERADGKRYVADGHQRLGLATRLKEGGDTSVALDGYLFREKDGWTAEDVRALAAKKNMQEGSGEAIDAARIMRDRPDILDDGLPMSGPMMRKATGLARLSDDAWGMAVNRVVDENHAALVGELLDPKLHAAAISDLAKFAPESDRAARSLLEEIVASGVRYESQVDMFGAFDMSKSLIGERVKVLDAAQKALRSDKRLFSMLSERADVIEAAGNQLDNSGNATRAVTAETVGAIVDRLARSRGPVSDALSGAAMRFAEGSSAVKEARGFVDEVQRLIDRDGLKALLEEPVPQLASGRVVEPATPEALELAGEIPDEPSMFGAADLGQAPTSIWDAIPDGVDVDGNPRFATAENLFERATRDEDYADLVTACRS